MTCAHFHITWICFQRFVFCFVFFFVLNWTSHTGAKTINATFPRAFFLPVPSNWLNASAAPAVLHFHKVGGVTRDAFTKK